MTLKCHRLFFVQNCNLDSTIINKIELQGLYVTKDPDPGPGDPKRPDPDTGYRTVLHLYTWLRHQIYLFDKFLPVKLLHRHVVSNIFVFINFRGLYCQECSVQRPYFYTRIFNKTVVCAGDNKVHCSKLLNKKYF